jgi:hypothetical protein
MAGEDGLYFVEVKMTDPERAQLRERLQEILHNLKQCGILVLSTDELTVDLTAAVSLLGEPETPALNRGDIVRAVKGVRAEPDLSRAVDIAIAHLVKPAESPVSR